MADIEVFINKWAGWIMIENDVISIDHSRGKFPKRWQTVLEDDISKLIESHNELTFNKGLT